MKRVHEITLTHKNQRKILKYTPTQVFTSARFPIQQTEIPDFNLGTICHVIQIVSIKINPKNSLLASQPVQAPPRDKISPPPLSSRLASLPLSLSRISFILRSFFQAMVNYFILTLVKRKFSTEIKWRTPSSSEGQNLIT